MLDTTRHLAALVIRYAHRTDAIAARIVLASAFLIGLTDSQAGATPKGAMHASCPGAIIKRSASGLAISGSVVHLGVPDKSN